MGLKVSEYSSMFNRAMLQAGSSSGLDMTVKGAGVGALVGGVQGSFSDYDGMFGGATKGAIMGGLGGVGLKYAGSRYSKGYATSVGSKFNPLDISHTSLEGRTERLGVKTSHFKTGKFDSKENWFDTQYTAFDDYKAVTKYHNSLG